MKAVSKRPKRSVSRPNYRDLSDVSLPRLSKQLSKRICVEKADSKLYRLNVLEEEIKGSSKD